ncbi:M30 family zinc metallopeptidase [Curvibacter gracilis]|uniref:M30 family zinc metallopeptidase n=1 Tax=Curvibacter gracilis TaxID=230310 RepID=UPI00146FAF97|nr:PKD domain-containing protein [Curvibacter gracilis]
MNLRAKVRSFGQLAAAGVLILGLSACGGGGSGGSSDIGLGTPSAGSAPSAPTVTITNGSAAYAQNTVKFSASSTDPAGRALSFTWDFGDGSSAVTGASVAHRYAAAGTFDLKLTATNTANVSATSTIPIEVLSPAPSTPQLTINNGTVVYATVAASLSASSTDPLGLNLGYAWDFGDGQSATGASVTHVFNSAGTYTLAVKATNTASQSTSATQQITVLAPAVTTPVISSSPSSPRVGQTVNFVGRASSSKGLAITYQWMFGDGSTATGSSVSHTYTSAGTYSVSLTAQDSNGNAATATFQQTIMGTADSSALVVDCSGSNCGALSASSYSGNGVGAWRFVNPVNAPTTLNINISGVKSGQHATLIFTNTGTTTAQSPSEGSLSSPVLAASGNAAARTTTTVQTAERLLSADAEAQSHSELLAKNRAMAGLLAGNSTARSAQSGSNTSLLGGRSTQLNSTPAVGTARTWNDLYNSLTTPVLYATTAAATCSLPSGRNVVFWLDSEATRTGLVSASDITAMQTTVCGASGGFDRMNALLGDVWGPSANNYSTQLIQDGSSLLDINIAIVNAPSTAGWAGYFYGVNNFLKSAATTTANSNQALVFFINAAQIQASRAYAISSLLHEATHMTNFYQRSVARNTSHDTWLEETSAMMTEDIVTPVVNAGYNPIASIRVPTYMATGGGTSYINWVDLSGKNYAIGGAFGAYLNRRYGLSVYKQLITTCNDGGSASNGSYTCLDALIKANGGSGLADDFAHFGAALFAPVPLTLAIAQYGLPSKTDGGYTLGAVDTTQFASKLPSQPTPIGASGFSATSHYYSVDTIGTGAVSYVRNNVIVPAGSTLLLVIR